MEPIDPDNVIVLRPRAPRASYCQDCDPGASYPFSIEIRADPRTGDILTPCPACERHALAVVRASGGRRKVGL